MDEIELVNRHCGKWSDKNVPHKGWECVDIEDTGAPDSICEMCESQHIRYIHYMKHPDYKEILRAGCICAGHMEANLINAKKRDDFMKSRSDKRKRWLNHRGWKISKKGNDWIKTEGFLIVMKSHDTYWSGLIRSENDSFKKWSRRKYQSINEAKLAVFDYLTKILADNN
jgi:hypothetical protein